MFDLVTQEAAQQGLNFILGFFIFLVITAISFPVIVLVLQYLIVEPISKLVDMIRERRNRRFLL